MNMKKSGILSAATAAVLGFAAPAAHAAWTLNMTPGITAISRRIYEMHMLMYWWCVAIAVFVFGWMIYLIVCFRKSQGAGAHAKLVHNTTPPIIWTALPGPIPIIIAVPGPPTLLP